MTLKKAIREWSQAWRYPRHILLGDQYWYGGLEILNRVFEIKPNQLLYGFLQHGWTFTVETMPKIRNRAGKSLPKLLWSNRLFNEEISRKKALDSDPILIGSPWCHMLNLLGYQLTANGLSCPTQKKEERNQVVTYFPNHSTMDFSLDRTYFESIDVDEQWGEIEVCLGWLDFLNPEVRALYGRYDLSVVCMGYRGNASAEGPSALAGGRVEFLFSVLKQIENSHTVIFDEISSPFWYSLSLGKKIILRDKTHVYDDYKKKLGVEGGQFVSTSEILHLTGLTSLNVGQVFTPDAMSISIALNELGWPACQDLSVAKSKLRTFPSKANIEAESALIKVLEKFMT